MGGVSFCSVSGYVSFFRTLYFSTCHRRCARTFLILPPTHRVAVGSWWKMQNANVNFANRPTLMPRSPWLAAKEQKDQMMCLLV